MRLLHCAATVTPWFPAYRISHQPRATINRKGMEKSDRRYFFHRYQLISTSIEVGWSGHRRRARQHLSHLVGIRDFYVKKNCIDSMRVFAFAS